MVWGAKRPRSYTRKSLEQVVAVSRISGISSTYTGPLDGTVYVWELPTTQSSQFEWLMFNHDPQRSGRFMVGLQPPTTATPTIPAVSPTPTPGTSDLTPPTITVFSPLSGDFLPTKGSQKITTSAQDPSGVLTITISFDTLLLKSCNTTTTCQYNLSNSFISKLTSGIHTITVSATDKSLNKNKGTKSITVNK